MFLGSMPWAAEFSAGMGSLGYAHGMPGRLIGAAGSSVYALFAKMFLATQVCSISSATVAHSFGSRYHVVSSAFVVAHPFLVDMAC